MSAQKSTFDGFVAEGPLGDYEGDTDTRADYLVFGLYIAATLGFLATKWCFARSETLLRKAFSVGVWGGKLLVFTIGATVAARVAEAHFN